MPRARLVALGASNLTRGIACVLDAGRHLAQGPVEVLAALGHGRSYGIQTRMLGRALPGMDGCGLWEALAKASPLPTTALLMDIGNDLLYGQEVPTILGWVERALVRLRARAERVVVAEMPMRSIRTIGPARYALFRSILFPGCRIPLAGMQARAEALHDGVARLAQQHGASFVPLRPEWYGFDPIHIRRRCWPAACRDLLGGVGAGADPAWGRGFFRRLALLRAAPAERVRWGRLQQTPQPAVREPDGSTVALY